MARLVLESRAELTNNFHDVHGGVLMSRLDRTMSSAAISKSGFSKAVVTIDMSTAFLKPGRGPLAAHATATGRGRPVCFCEARVLDAHSDVVAEAMDTFKCVRPQDRAK